jgi:putative membrane protein
MSLLLGLSAAAIAFLFWIIYGAAPLREQGEGAFALSSFNAFCNAVTTLFLISGILAIKKGDELRHKRRLLAAFVSSSCFLLGYITYHTLYGDSTYPGQGWLRPVYFTLLISHIVLSLPTLPMVLITFYLGYTDRRALHKRWAKFTFPLWF